MIEQIIYEHLNAVLPTYPLVAKETETPPFCVYASSNGEARKTLSGYTDLIETTVRIDFFNTDYFGLKTHVDDVLKRQWVGSYVINGKTYVVQDMWYMSSTETFIEDLETNAATLSIGLAYKIKN